METYFKPLFLALQKRIMENVPEIRFIDQNIGQLGFDEYRAMVSFPAVLVDFPSTSFSALSGNAQLGISFIEITLVFAPYSQTYQMAPDNVKDLGLQYFEIEQKVFAALQVVHCLPSAPCGRLLISVGCIWQRTHTSLQFYLLLMGGIFLFFAYFCSLSLLFLLLAQRYR